MLAAAPPASNRDTDMNMNKMVYGRNLNPTTPWRWLCIAQRVVQISTLAMTVQMDLADPSS